MTRQIKFIKGEMYEYETYPLVDQYDKVLKAKPEAFDFSQPDARQRAKFEAISLLETMSKHHGVGLAANQVGLNYRLFVMGSQGVGYAFFNPEILEVTGMTSFEEGCLTFPGLFLPVKRPETVKIKYWDMNGVEKEQTFTGLSARIVLHEYDHLEGVLMTSKVSPLILERQKRKVKKNLKLLQAQYDRIEKERIIEQAAAKVVAEAAKTWSQEEMDFAAENPGMSYDKIREVLQARHAANANVVVETVKVAPLAPPVTYVADKPTQKNIDENQTLTIETDK